MIRVSRLGDYAIVLMAAIARSASGRAATARELADVTRVPTPTVSKILKTLAREGLLLSQRGKSGGYTLAREAKDISVAQIISAIEGPIALTECLAGQPSVCALQTGCPCRTNWNRINRAVLEALDKVRLDTMVPPEHGHPSAPPTGGLQVRSRATDSQGATEVDE